MNKCLMIKNEAYDSPKKNTRHMITFYKIKRYSSQNIKGYREDRNPHFRSSKEELNWRLETRRLVIKAFGFCLSRSKIKYMKCNFN